MKEGDIRELLKEQRGEITQREIYKALGKIEKNSSNKKILQKLEEQENEHYHFWKRITKKDVSPSRLDIIITKFLAKILGLNFVIKHLENSEQKIYKRQRELIGKIPGVKKILEQDKVHEDKLVSMINEERLEYASSVVLGLNDALVEITGVLTGLTFSLKNSSLIALTGLITGIAAALSMAASEYQSTKEEEGKNPIKAAVYTGIAYMVTVFLLVCPFFIFKNFYISLVATIIIGFLNIGAFNYYISIAKNVPFSKRFLSMASVVIGVSVISLGLSFVVKKFLGITI